MKQISNLSKIFTYIHDIEYDPKYKIDKKIMFEEEKQVPKEVEQQPQPKKFIIVDDPPRYKQEQKQRKVNKLPLPKRILYFDDVAGQLNDPVLNQLLKMGRHMRTIIYICTQSIIDIKKNLYDQFSRIFLGHGIQIDYIIKASERIGFDIEEYKNEKYSFLLIDTINNERKTIMSDLTPLNTT
jgi:hypothetical protein